MSLFWLHAIMALTRAIGTVVFPQERPSLLPLPIRTMSCVLLNTAYLVTPGSRARLLGPRKFGLSRMSLSGIMLCLQHQTGQLPQGPATSETAALRITILRSILANTHVLIRNLVTLGSRTGLLGLRKFGHYMLSLSGTMLCLLNPIGQLPQGPATSETAA